MGSIRRLGEGSAWKVAATIVLALLVVGPGTADDQRIAPPVRTSAIALSAPVATGAPIVTQVPFTFRASGANGTGRITAPGLPCAGGGTGDFWHYGYESSLTPGAFSPLATDVRMNLDVHRSAAIGLSGAPNGFLQGRESTVALVNERGTLVLRLEDGGSCALSTASVSPTTATTKGTWTIGQGSGVYATVDGTGTFDLSADVAPGADNPWWVVLGGALGVAPPDPQVSVVRTSWGGALGLDYVFRIVTVQLRVTNTGAGDALGLRVIGGPSAGGKATLLTPLPLELGDLPAGHSVDVVLRYQLGLLSPCLAVILKCQFGISVATRMTDALDLPVADADTVAVVAPTLPPPL